MRSKITAIIITVLFLLGSAAPILSMGEEDIGTFNDADLDRTMVFPAAGHNNSTTISIPHDAYVKDVSMNITGLPYHMNGSVHHTSDADFEGAEEKVNLSIADGDVGLTTIGGSWSQGTDGEFNESSGENITVRDGVRLAEKGEYEPDEHTVGLWHFNEGSGLVAKDSSSVGNNGTLNNDPQWTTEGRFGKALYFYGNNDRKVIVPTSSEINFGTDDSFTVEAWVKPDGYPGLIIRHGEITTGPGYQIELDISDNGRMDWSLRTDSTYKSIIYSEEKFLEEEWHHIAGVRDTDEDKMKLYIDGILVNETTDQSNELATFENWGIGGSGNLSRPTWSFDGYIDEVRFSNISRSSFNLGFSNNGSLTSNSISSFGPDYGNLRVNITTPPHTGYNVDILDTNNNTIRSRLHNGDPITVDTSQYPQIKLKMNMWTDDNLTTPVLHSWGIGTRIADYFNQENLVGQKKNITIENDVRLAELGEYEPDEHTVGLWHFNEGEGTETNDSSGNGNHGSLINDPQWAEGRFGNGIHFTGDTNQKILIPYNEEMDFGTDDSFTIEAWIKPEGYPGIIARHDNHPTTPRHQIDVYITDNNWIAYDITSNTNEKGATREDIDLNDGKWHHIAAVRDTDDDKVRLYLDNILINESTDNSKNTSSDEGWAFGSDAAASLTNWVYEGYMDEVRFSDIARSSFPVYYESGGLVSKKISLPVAPSAFYNISWSEELSSGSDITMQFRTSKDNQTWTPWENISNPDISIDSLPQRYIQWRFNLSTTNTTNTPVLYDVAVEYTVYLTNGSLGSTAMATPYNITSLIPIVNKTLYDQQLEMFVSNDNGTSWHRVQNNTTFDLPTDGKRLKYKIEFTGNGSYSPILHDISLNYTMESYPRTPGLDVGDDGDIEWSYNGTLNHTSIFSGQFFVAELNSYLENHQDDVDADGNISVPLNVSVSSPGKVRLSDLSITYAPHPDTEYGPLGEDVPLDTGIWINFTEPMDTASVEGNISISPTVVGSFQWSADGKGMTFTPSNDLEENTTYRVQLEKGVFTEEGNWLREDLAWNFTTELLPPVVLDCYPDMGDSPVSLNPTVKVTFSKDMDQSSVWDSLEIEPSAKVKDSTKSGTTISFYLGAELKPSTVYSVTVTTGATALNGVSLEEDFTWNFTTTDENDTDIAPPTVIGTDPEAGAEDVPVHTNIDVFFSEAMDAYGLKQAFEISPEVEGGLITRTNSVTFTPVDGLECDTVYTVTIAGTAENLAGITLDGDGDGEAEGPQEDDHVFTFTTASGPADVTPPSVLSFEPVGANVPVDSRISATFSENMDRDSVNTSLEVSPAIDGAISWNGPGITFTPEAPLDYCTEYRVTIGDGATDPSGNGLTTDFVWVFGTICELSPEVVDWFPKGTDRSDLHPTIKVEFDVEMNRSTVWDSITVDPSIPLSNYTQVGTEFEFYLQGDLDPETTYTVTVSTGARSLEGVGLAEDFSWDFTTRAEGTADDSLPVVLGSDPRDNERDVESDLSVISVYFSEAMDRESVEEHFQILPPVSGEHYWNGNTLLFILDSDETLVPGETYRVVIGNGSADLAGNRLDGNRDGTHEDTPMDAHVFSFVIEDDPTYDRVRPSVVSSTPRGHDVSNDTLITVTFSEHMNGTVMDSAFSISPSVGGDLTMDGSTLTFEPRTPLLDNTTYTVTIAGIASDLNGNRMGEDHSWSFRTAPVEETPGPGPGPGPDDDEDDWPTELCGTLWFLPLLLIIAVLVMAFAFYKMRARPPEDDTDDISFEELEEEELEEDLGEEPLVAGAGEEDDEEEEVAAVEPMLIEDIFLIYKDGRLIEHKSKRDDDPDRGDIIGGMLTAIQQFVKDALSEGDEGELGAMEYGDKKIIFEKSQNLILAMVIRGKEAEGVREEMRHAVERIEGKHAGIVEDWDGDLSDFKGLGPILGGLMALEVLPQVETEDPEKKVRTLSGLEFHQGYVRIKIAVKNKLSTTITDASFDLLYDSKALRLSHLEPDFEHSRSKVEIGNVSPGQKKTVAYYLDPLICQESMVDGTLTFKDYLGELHHVDMKRRPVDIVCPLFYTEETVNVAMLKRLLDKLRYKDSRMYRFKDTSDLDKIFDVGKSVVQGFDVKLVREFTEEEPVMNEAWYYGKTKETEEEMVIKVALSGETGILEIFVGSSNLSTLTGLLAELRSKMRKAIRKSTDVKKLRSVSEENREKLLKDTTTLLSKYAETEIDAGDMEASI